MADTGGRDEYVADLVARRAILEEAIAKIRRVHPQIVDQVWTAADLDNLGYGGRAIADGDPWGVSLRVISAIEAEWKLRGVPLPDLERYMTLPQHSTRNIARMAGRAVQEVLGFPI